MYTCNLEFQGRTDSQRKPDRRHTNTSIFDNRYIEGYFTNEHGTFVRCVMADSGFKENIKLSDIQFRVKSLFSLSLGGNESIPYIELEIFDGEKLTVCSAPCNQVGKRTRANKLLRELSYDISYDLGRAIYYAARYAAEDGSIPRIHNRNLLEKHMQPVDMTSHLDFRALENHLTSYCTTTKGTFISEIDPDGFERLKHISDAQIILGDIPHDCVGGDAEIGLTVIDKFGKKTEGLRLSFASLMEMPNHNGLESFRRAGGTCSSKVGESIYKAAMLSNMLKQYA